MKAIGLAAALATFVPTLAMPVGASAADLIVMPQASSGQWQPAPDSLPKGSQMDKVLGDPSKPGPFVIRFKFPKNSVIPPHMHSADETVTVLAGDIWHATGGTFDKSKGTDLKVGGFVYLPQGMPHYLWTTSEPVEVQVNGTGPFGLQFVNPADNPANTSKKS